MKNKKRHTWGEIEKNIFTEQQQCKKCKLYRFKCLGIWMYSNEKTTERNPFVDKLNNEGCF